MTKCPKGVTTPQAWLDTFKLETVVKPAKGKGKKNAEASSKASTPTKDGEKPTKSPSKAEEEKAAKAEV